ncbi:ABC transporter permease [Hymenobacter sp. DG25A]|uniref:ABC transporter permease n=1 Tax=Hymenobacter sp. DG25A TaxID=1385663 RepID=UPI0006C84A9E|nr:ABC transporter permease [Hymenobacter sp. DG25A]
MKTKRRVIPWQRALALGWLGLVGALGVFAPCLPLPYLPATSDALSLSTPPQLGSAVAAAHWLGTDALGRDVLTELVYGCRTLLLVSLPATLLLTAVGMALGSVAGYYAVSRLRWAKAYWVALALWLVCTLAYAPLLGAGNAAAYLQWLLALGIGTVLAFLLRSFSWGRQPAAFPIDSLVLGSAALLGSVPRLILVLTVAAILPLSFVSMPLLLGLTCWPGMMRLVRAEALRIRELPYLEAARALGLPDSRIVSRHVLPGLWPVVRAAFPLYLTLIVTTETTISFLGVGLPAETASWGHLLSSARLAPGNWWLIVFPGFSLVCTIISLRFLTQKQVFSASTPK